MTVFPAQIQPKVKTIFQMQLKVIPIGSSQLVHCSVHARRRRLKEEIFLFSDGVVFLPDGPCSSLRSSAAIGSDGQ